MSHFDVYTDGASSHNGKPECVAGWSTVIMNEGKGNLKPSVIRYGHISQSASNNKGELMGVLVALHMVQNVSQNSTVCIYTDSQYVQKAITEWRRSWELRGFAGVKNMGLLRPIYDIMDKVNNVKVCWVRGHDGNEGNEIADLWAVNGKKLISPNGSPGVIMVEEQRLIDNGWDWRE